MKQYPYIGKCVFSSAVVMFVSKGRAVTIDKGNSRYSGLELGLVERPFANITREYLANTWGVVESKEHAEFIIELCKVNDIEVFNGFDIGITDFAIVENEVIFTYGKPHVSECDKQITIPLPPKESYNIEVKNNTELNVDITRNKDTVNIMIDKETPKADITEAGHNLVFAASECKEWPCINDEVTWGDLTHKGVVKSISDGFAWIKRDSGEYETVYISSLQKPKTPEEALRDDLASLVGKSMIDNKTNGDIANILLTKYNITPKEV